MVFIKGNFSSSSCSIQAVCVCALSKTLVPQSSCTVTISSLRYCAELDGVPKVGPTAPGKNGQAAFYWPPILAYIRYVLHNRRPRAQVRQMMGVKRLAAHQGRSRRGGAALRIGAPVSTRTRSRGGRRSPPPPWRGRRQDCPDPHPPPPESPQSLIPGRTCQPAF
jgi:hypothetical protein